MREDTGTVTDIMSVWDQSIRTNVPLTVLSSLATSFVPLKTNRRARASAMAFQVQVCVPHAPVYQFSSRTLNGLRILPLAFPLRCVMMPSKLLRLSQSHVQLVLLPCRDHHDHHDHGRTLPYHRQAWIPTEDSRLLHSHSSFTFVSAISQVPAISWCSSENTNACNAWNIDVEQTRTLNSKPKAEHNEIWRAWQSVIERLVDTPTQHREMTCRLQ